MDANTMAPDTQRKTDKKQKFAEFFKDVYLPHVENRKRSWRMDERLARNHILPFFDNMHLDAIAARDVETWLSQLRAKGLAPATCNRILAVLKSVFTLAEIFGIIAPTASPCRYVRSLKLLGRRERFLSQGEGQKLMEYLQRDTSLQSKAIQLLLLTGARKNEIVRARWENLNLESRILTVPLAKSGQPRYIYLSVEAIAVFKSITPKEGQPWIFPGRKKDKPLTTLYTYWDKTRNVLGLRGVRLHDLRHSYASYLVGSGHTLYEVQQLLGHTDPRTTMRYAHFAHEMLVKATACVSEILVKAAIKPKRKKRNTTKPRATNKSVRRPNGSYNNTVQMLR